MTNPSSLREGVRPAGMFASAIAAVSALVPTRISGPAGGASSATIASSAPVIFFTYAWRSFAAAETCWATASPSAGWTAAFGTTIVAAGAPSFVTGNAPAAVARTMLRNRPIRKTARDMRRSVPKPFERQNVTLPAHAPRHRHRHQRHQEPHHGRGRQNPGDPHRCPHPPDPPTRLDGAGPR